MKIKRLIASIVSAAFCLTMISGTASAHSNDVWAGRYFRLIPSTTAGGEPRLVERDTADFVLRINPSALNSTLTYNDVYTHATDWNGISSKVKLTTINNANGTLPNLSDQIDVEGEIIPTIDEYITFGYTYPYDMYGEEAELYAWWCGAKIMMNISNDVMTYYLYYDETGLQPRKTFVHEVGHVLKLSHPIQSSRAEGHTIDGYPWAIMNQGSVDYSSYTSPTVTQHDKDCLKEKWGA